LAVIPSRIASFALVFAVLVIAGAKGRLAYGAAADDKGLEMLGSWLDKLLDGMPVKIKPQKVIPIADENLQKVFPDDRFYGVYFATWPVAPRLPKELSYETLMRLPVGAPIEAIRDQDALRSFLARALAGIQDDGRARAAVLASLRLAEAVSKAGAYSFEKPDLSVVREGKSTVATARAAVQEPGGGEISIRLEFDADGKTKPDSISIDDRTRRGPPSRP
jgi:hypothetical protein